MGNDTWVDDLSDNTWTDQAPASAPPERDDHAMAYIGGEKVPLLVGSTTSVRLSTGRTVTPGSTTSATTPGRRWPRTHIPPRARHDSAYLDGDRVLLYGGWFRPYDYPPPPTEYYDDTWVMT